MYRDTQVTVGRQEETLEVEYIESTMPPTRLAALPHDEWVSSISCFVPGFAPSWFYFKPMRALMVLRQPLPHRFIRRCITRIRPQPDSLSHCTLTCGSHHVLRHRALAARSSPRGGSARGKRLARPHGADLTSIARRDSDDLHAARDVALA